MIDSILADPKGKNLYSENHEAKRNCRRHRSSEQSTPESTDLAAA